MLKSAPTDLLHTLRLGQDQLSSAERRVADLVLAAPQEVVRLAVADIASRAGVSQPTVIRFCRRLGFSGLSDFKLRLAGALVSGVPYVHANVGADDGVAAITAKIFENTIAALRDGRASLPLAATEAAIAALATARRIEFHGLGNSGIIAADAQHKFFRLGIPTVAYADSHIQIMSAALLGPGDVLVAISSSGRSQDLTEAAETARANGATVIALTVPASPLAGCSDIALTIDAPEDTETYSPMLSRLLHLVVIDILTTGVALRLGPDAAARMERAKRSLRQKRLKL